ncbi:hypothetical protein DPEC_G00071030 [Dallia pectoralis]|uniref:Uncharacterized protein n=1 Tax=Dallia pectoralis TaxID=75939 RepID=A0ACC2H3D8_DALPE|nr:hypothetical protein DPEC_G00071030 [Dallia pectoralis]
MVTPGFTNGPDEATLVLRGQPCLQREFWFRRVHLYPAELPPLVCLQNDGRAGQLTGANTGRIVTTPPERPELAFVVRTDHLLGCRVGKSYRACGSDVKSYRACGL